MVKNLNAALKEAEISPAIVPDNFAPSTSIEVKFSNGFEVTAGNFIKPSDSAEVPKVIFTAPDKDAEYTLLMVDPDAPTKQDPSLGPYRHWVVVNIPSTGEFSKATEMSPYIGPGPPPKTREHRYIFLLYKQPKSQIDFGVLPEEFIKWDFESFVQQHKLELIGANFFISWNDDK